MAGNVIARGRGTNAQKTAALAYLALAEDLDALLWTEDGALLKPAPGRAVDGATLLAKLA